MRSRKIEKMRRNLMRSNTRLLLTSVVVFQLLAFLLLTVKPGNESMQTLILAAAVPLSTLLITNLMGKF